MRNLLLLSLLAILVFGCNTTETSNSSDRKNENGTSDKKYAIKSGIINYKINMMGMETKMNVFFQDYGKTEASVTETEIMGKKAILQTLQKDNFYYNFSTDKKTGSKYQMNGNDTTEEPGTKKMTVAYILKKGGKKVGSEKILDKDCNIYQYTENGVESKVWIWHNMFLKNIVSQNGMEMIMVATKIEETNSFPSGIFEVPKNIIFSNPADEMKSDPDFENKDAKG